MSDTTSNGGGNGRAVKPTDMTYRAFQTAYDTFNRQLFARRLPACRITLRTFGKARGYFSPDRFVHLRDVTTTHEIALDPRQFMDRTTLEVLSTLAHEMCHLEQAEYGTPSRAGYHNRGWGELMTRIGLVPSDTGAPGGKQTGQAVTHYIEPGGRFETVAQRLVDSGRFAIGWADIEGFLQDEPTGTAGGTKPGPGTTVVRGRAKSQRSGVRSKYVCSTCGAAVWGKAGLIIGCLGAGDETHDAAVMVGH